jgi:DNA-binding NtrC family response regulator
VNPFNSQQKRILIASSEDIIRMYLSRELKHAGLQLDLAKDGMEALFLINTLRMTHQSFDLYLIDTDLAKFNYINLIIKIMELNLTKPIILISGDHNTREDSDSIDDPVIRILKKPIRKDNLLSVVDSCMQIRMTDHSNSED